MAYTGSSIVDYLKSVGQDSSFSARTNLAKQQGISNYTGTADQNLKLLGILRGGGGGQSQNQAPAPSPASTSTPAVSANPLQEVNTLIQDSFNKLKNDASTLFGKYKENHPFNFDQVLASKTAQAKEQIDPYYNETVTDYLTGVHRRLGRSKEDTRNLLSELNAQTESFSAGTKLALSRAIEKSQQGYADAGLLNSGAAFRDTGLATVSSNQTLADYLRGQTFKANTATTGEQRIAEDTALAQKMDVRNIERQRLTDIEARKAQLAKEAGLQYVQGFQSTLPPELQANTGFDLLKSLGINS